MDPSERKHSHEETYVHGKDELHRHMDRTRLFPNLEIQTEKTSKYSLYCNK